MKPQLRSGRGGSRGITAFTFLRYDNATGIHSPHLSAAAAILRLQPNRLSEFAVSSRGRALGLKMVEAVTEFAAARLDCGYAIMLPAPIKYEEGDPYTNDDPRFACARRRLFAYYGSLGFVRPSARSEHLYKKL